MKAIYRKNRKNFFSFYYKKQEKTHLTRSKVCFQLKSGNYLSSRQLTASTFGVKELNFCVRYGNRWILFAIITAMVIYPAFFWALHIRILLRLHPFPGASRANLLKEDLQLHSKAYYFCNYFSLFRQSVKILVFVSLRFVLFFSFEIKPSTYQYRSANTLLHLHLRPINLVVCKGSY